MPPEKLHPNLEYAQYSVPEITILENESYASLVDIISNSPAYADVMTRVNPHKRDGAMLDRLFGDCLEHHPDFQLLLDEATDREVAWKSSEWRENIFNSPQQVVIAGSGQTAAVFSAALAYYGIRSIVIEREHTIGGNFRSMRGPSILSTTKADVNTLGPYSAVQPKGLSPGDRTLLNRWGSAVGIDIAANTLPLTDAEFEGVREIEAQERGVLVDVYDHVDRMTKTIPAKYFINATGLERYANIFADESSNALFVHEQQRGRLAQVVTDNQIFSWAADLLTPMSFENYNQVVLIGGGEGAKAVARFLYGYEYAKTGRAVPPKIIWVISDESEIKGDLIRSFPSGAITIVEGKAYAIEKARRGMMQVSVMLRRGRQVDIAQGDHVVYAGGYPREKGYDVIGELVETFISPSEIRANKDIALEIPGSVLTLGNNTQITFLGKGARIPYSYDEGYDHEASSRKEQYEEVDLDANKAIFFEWFSTASFIRLHGNLVKDQAVINDIFKRFDEYLKEGGLSIMARNGTEYFFHKATETITYSENGKEPVTMRSDHPHVNSWFAGKVKRLMIKDHPVWDKEVNLRYMFHNVDIIGPGNGYRLTDSYRATDHRFYDLPANATAAGVFEPGITARAEEIAGELGGRAGAGIPPVGRQSIELPYISDNEERGLTTSFSFNLEVYQRAQISPYVTDEFLELAIATTLSDVIFPYDMEEVTFTSQLVRQDGEGNVYFDLTSFDIPSTEAYAYLAQKLLSDRIIQHILVQFTDEGVNAVLTIPIKNQKADFLRASVSIEEAA